MAVRPPPRAPHGKQRGVALAMLLWMLAALTLLVSGVVFQSRTDVQLTRLYLDQARVQAAALGAAHLLLAEQALAASSGELNSGGIFAREYELNGLQLHARAVPVGGLVDLNLASPELLAVMFQYLGRLDANDAEQLAEQLVDWRMPPQVDVAADVAADSAEGEEPALIGNGMLTVVEDLLRVPGMSRAVYDRVRTAVHVEPGGQQGVDPLAAPEDVLLLIANGDAGVVDTIIEARRDTSVSAADLPGGLDPLYLASGGAGGYRVDVHVAQQSQPPLVQRIWVRMTGGQGGVPWQFTRVLPVEVEPRLAGEGRHAG